MNDGLFGKAYNPDVLTCLANLSNDEVFTPPDVVNKMLDMLPQEIFKSPKTTFLDPACKTGVFLREIAKRLIVGLERKIPDLQERIDHIFHNQLYGIAITELTSLLSRRGVYCSKSAASEFSVSQFDSSEGNIRFKRIEHTWKDGKCIYCGASQGEYDRSKDLETHAYEFIHANKPEDIFKMKFDVIIGNPPYQLSDGGAQASASPIYHLFVQQAKKLKPRYLTMIIPARWMTGGKGLNEFRRNMINDKHIVKLHDFADASECFTGVEIKGGVCYFLRDREQEGKCKFWRHDSGGVRYSERFLKEEGVDVCIRDERLIDIKNRVWEFSQDTFAEIVSSMKPYGLRGDFFGNEVKYGLPKVSEKETYNCYRIIGLERLRRVVRYINNDYPIPKKGLIGKFKIFITRNYGCGDLGEIPSSPILATPNDICTETFVEIGPFATERERDNAYSYMRTKLFRLLVGIIKQDQGAGRGVYQFVPMQDFSKPWTDEELYAKYKLTQEEIDFIESMIKPME